MSNIVYTWEDEENIIEETELTDTQLVDVIGALDSIGKLVLDSFGDSLNLGGDQPDLSVNQSDLSVNQPNLSVNQPAVSSTYHESSGSYALPSNKFHKYEHKKLLLFLDIVKH